MDDTLHAVRRIHEFPRRRGSVRASDGPRTPNSVPSPFALDQLLTGISRGWGFSTPGFGFPNNETPSCLQAFARRLFILLFRDNGTPRHPQVLFRATELCTSCSRSAETGLHQKRGRGERRGMNSVRKLCEEPEGMSTCFA